MEYKNYTFEILIDDIIPPIPGTKNEFRFAAKTIYMRSPERKILWKYDSTAIGETWGHTKKDAEQRIIENTKKWIDKQLKKKNNT